MPQTTIGPAALVIAVALLLAWLGLVHWLTKGIRAAIPADPPASLEDRLYRALLLATSTPTPYRVDGAQLWHGCDRGENPVPRAKCIGCIVQDALSAYEVQRRAEREGEVQLMAGGLYAEGF